MILDAFTVAELKDLARAREIDLKGVSGREEVIQKVQKDFFLSTNIFPHQRHLTPEVRAILEYMGVVSTEVTIDEICDFLKLRKLIQGSHAFFARESYWNLIKQELILKGLVIIARRKESQGLKKKEEWQEYKLAIPPQFVPMIPIPELPAVELIPQELKSFSCVDFSRELILHLLGKKQVGNDEVLLGNDIDPGALRELVEKVAGKLVYGEQGIASREGNVPQFDCFQALLPLLEREVAAHKVGDLILRQLKRLKKGQWCEEKALEAAVTEYGLMKKGADVAGAFSTLLLPSGFGQKAVHQRLCYYRLAPEIFLYLTEGALPAFPGDETEFPDRQEDQVAFHGSKANPATLWRMMFIGRGMLVREWVVFKFDKVRLARLQKAGIDLSPLFASLKKVLPPSFVRQYAEFRSKLGKNTLYFHYTPIQINDEALALLLQTKLPELVPLGSQFYLLESGKVESFQALLKRNGYVARVVACEGGKEPQ